MLKPISLATALLLLIGCDNAPQWEDNADSQGHTAPTMATVKANEAFLEKRPFTNTQDFINARKGLIA